jgi:type IV secretory pathway VirB2 component (pilin)
MVARSARRRSVSARSAGRHAASSRVLSGLARAGLAARGVMYGIIGLIAIEIALGGSHQQADRSGAIRLVAATPFGTMTLWLLVIGFAGLTLWRLSEAAFGAAGPGGHKTSGRLICLVKALIYGALTVSILRYALGLGAPASTNSQSQDLTATALRHPGGQAAVAIAGVIIAGVGLYVAHAAYRRQFLRDMRMSTASATTRKAVTWLGEVGGVARGVVFVTVGIFLLVAAAEAKPGQAKGIDSALRALAHTPLGPWLLALVAVGLVLFGVYSCCEARWRQV